jgi:hypothetical protein
MKRFFFLALLLFEACGTRAAFAQADVKDSVAQTERLDSLEASSNIMVPFRPELLRAAHRHSVPPALLAGVIQEESDFKKYAERTEPAYQRNRKVRAAAKAWSQAHGGIPTVETELQDRARSMGLAQVMGERAREQGFDSTFLSALFDPDAAIDQGATLLHQLFTKYGRDTLAVISAYNQGNARKVRGTFANARYVYRVNVAWQHYDRVLHYASNNHESHPLQIARSSVSTPHDSSGTAKPAMQPRADTGNLAHKSDAPRGGNPADRYDRSPRHDPVGHLSPRESEPGRGYAAGVLWGFAACIACVLGLALLVERYERRRTGYALHLPRRAGKSIFPRSSPRRS